MGKITDVEHERFPQSYKNLTGKPFKLMRKTSKTPFDQGLLSFDIFMSIENVICRLNFDISGGHYSSSTGNNDIPLSKQSTINFSVPVLPIAHFQCH